MEVGKNKVFPFLTVLLVTSFLIGFFTILHTQNQTEISELSPEDAYLLFNNSCPCLVKILDVRTAEEYASGHLYRAINIPLSNLTSRLGELKHFLKDDTGKNHIITYVVYCASGVRGYQACQILIANNFTSVYNLEGGIQAWTKKGFPLETESSVQSAPENPSADYSQSCEGACGMISCFYSDNRYCHEPDTPCVARTKGSCSGSAWCPEPLPNSHFVSGSCSCASYPASWCGECGGYGAGKYHCPRRIPCRVAGGPCYYACDAGYVWDGSACVVPNNPPNAPALTSPVANAHFDPNTEITFSWMFSDPDDVDTQSAFQFQLDDNSDFSSPMIDTGKVASTSSETTRTLPSTVGLYYWRVKTWDNHDAEGDWSGGRQIIVDRIRIIDGGVIDDTIDVDSGGEIWYTAEYEYDHTVFDGSCGVLYLNGSAMTWSVDRWVYSFPYSTEGKREVFQISSVNDSNYGLTAINNTVGDIIIDKATMQIIIKKRVS